MRALCFWTCVNMVANAIGRCEVRTFKKHKEVQNAEYYLWNVSPNLNQNGTAFMHKLVARLFMDNEVLIVNAMPRDGGLESLVIADEWETPEDWPSRQREYKNVKCGEQVFQYPFPENQVLHLKLHHSAMRPVVDALYESYWKLASAAMKHYQWGKGQHWKVHVSQLASGGEGWAEKFQEMISAQVKPFLDSNGAILPEFDGYSYTNEGANTGSGDTRDIKAMIEDVFEFTCRGFLIPSVLCTGKVEATGNARLNFLTDVVDPICDQLSEEINRKRYGFAQWRAGNFVKIDSSSINHFDMFSNAANIEKLVGSAAYTINDVLRAANQPTIHEPWANEHYMTLNIQPVSQQTYNVGPAKGGET